MKKNHSRISGKMLHPWLYDAAMNKDQIPVDSSSKIEVDQNELFDNFNTTTLEDEVESAKTEFRSHATDEAVSLLADVKDELEAQGEATVSKTRQRVTEVATGVAKDAAYEMEAKKTAAVKDFERQVSELTGTEIAAVERMKSYDGGGVSASNKGSSHDLIIIVFRACTLAGFLTVGRNIWQRCNS